MMHNKLIFFFFLEAKKHNNEESIPPDSKYEISTSETFLYINDFSSSFSINAKGLASLLALHLIRISLQNLKILCSFEM